MKLILCALLALVGVAVRCNPDHYIINDRVDAMLPDLNNVLLKKGLDQIVVADYGVESAPILIGVKVSNMSSLKRTGDAEMWQSGDNDLTVTVNLGLREAKVKVQSVPFMGGASSVWEIRDSSAKVQLTMHPSPTAECVTTYQQFTITRLGDITIHTSDPKWDGKSPPQEIVDGLVVYYNKWINLPQNLDNVSKNIDLC